MAELLKHQLNLQSAEELAQQIQKEWTDFNSEAFLALVAENFENLELMQRGAQIARVLRQYLPDNTEQALSILRTSMGVTLGQNHGYGKAPFFYLPHSFFISEYGLPYFDAAMQTQYELTQRFTAEFCIRPFLRHYPEQTMSKLDEWVKDKNEHVRRLVSEGTRPRLPWASRLPAFQKDPQPVIQLLDILKDDPVLYVRRSVANNLNDISKDHPQLVVDLMENWQKDASVQRQWLIRHALRSLIKQGHQGALAVLGYVQDIQIAIENPQITPRQANLGEEVKVSFDLVSRSSQTQPLMIDFCVYFMKSNGTQNGEVFKLKSLQLGPGEKIHLAKKVSLKAMTTRTLYAGCHRVEALINGTAHKLGYFDLQLNQKQV
ncbi:DNA alkylation repair protein [Aliidiomarina minuta]|uniref:DNA alkylation repair protein n=1 Tax=Aliidiomarina minuta TaxID=880057 RepID=A0A432W7J6_9GAMM|nr:DNA alkylation repair protein [Aliidiomarina minuta]RUO25926.1 DNA alkylation repair protein [Aliidiomarina minuta]